MSKEKFADFVMITSGFLAGSLALWILFWAALRWFQYLGRLRFPHQ